MHRLLSLTLALGLTIHEIVANPLGRRSWSPSGTHHNTSPGPAGSSSSSRLPPSKRQGNSQSTAVAPHVTVIPAPSYSNPPLLGQFQNGPLPQPIRGDGAGATFLDEQNEPLTRESPDFVVSPSTDAGTIDNAKWPFALSHNRVQQGGWARQQTIRDMPTAKDLAGVNMRLKANAYRELHWHTQAEWSYMIAGSARINAVNQDGKAYAADIYPGDLWYFPPGIPHSIQGLSDIADGCEFLLVFDDGNFSEDDTFLVSDWLAHVPKEVLARNFKLPIEVFKNIPSRQLWIFPGNASEPLSKDLEIVKSVGEVPQPYSLAFSKMNYTKVDGGSIKKADSVGSFPVSKTIAVQEVTVETGAIRELHWHPTEPEWTYFLTGDARITVYGASGNARTYDYGPTDIAYIQPSFGHYIENTGNSTLKFLEIFKSKRVEDVSLSQWLALTPPSIVKSTLDVGDDFIAHLSKEKQVVIGPA